MHFTNDKKKFKNATVALQKKSYFLFFAVSMPEGSRCDFNKGVCGWRVPSQIPTKSG